MNLYTVSILTSKTDCNKHFNSEGGTTPKHNGQFVLETFGFDSNFEFASKLQSLTSKQVIMLDVPKVMPRDGSLINIITKSKFASIFGEFTPSEPLQNWDGQWYMPRVNTCFKRGGVMLLDLDGCKGHENVSVDKIIELLGVGNAPLIYTPSNTSRVLESTKSHVFVLTDGGDCKQWMNKATRLMQSQSYCNTVDGKKTLIDASVGALNRVVYEGAPTVDPQDFSLSVAPKVVRLMGGSTALDLSAIPTVTNSQVYEGIAKATNKSFSNIKNRVKPNEIDRSIIKPDTLVKLKNGDEFLWKDIAEWTQPFLKKHGETDRYEWKVRCYIPEDVRSDSTACSGFIKMMSGEIRMLDVSGDMIWYTTERERVDFSKEAALVKEAALLKEPNFLTEPDFSKEPTTPTAFGIGLADLKGDLIFKKMIKEIESYLEREVGYLQFNDLIDVEAWRKAYANAFIVNDRLRALSYFDILCDIRHTEAAIWFDDIGLHVDLTEMVSDTNSNKAKAKIQKTVRAIFMSSLKMSGNRKAANEEIDMFTDTTYIDKRGEVGTCMRPFELFDNVLAPQFTDKPLVDAFKLHMPILDDFLDSIIYSRFSHEHRKSSHIFECASSWGKTYFFERVLGELGIVKFVNAAELKKANNGEPSGLSPEDFKNTMVLVVDESNYIPAVFKELDSVLNVAAKGRQKVPVNIYTKVLLSAEGVTDDGIDEQLRNRFNIFKSSEEFTGADATKDAVQRYAADRMNKLVKKLKALGKVDAAIAGAKGVSEYFASHTIKSSTVNQFDDEIAPAIEGLRHLIADCVNNNNRPKIAGHGTGDGRVDELIQSHLVFNRHNDVVVQRPAKLLTEYLKFMFTDDKFKSVKRSKSKYTALFGKTKDYRIGNSTIKGVLIPTLRESTRIKLTVVD